MVKSSIKNNDTSSSSDNQEIIGEGRPISTEMVVATMKTSGNKRVAPLDEDAGSIRVTSIHHSKRSKTESTGTATTQSRFQEEEHEQQRLDEPAQPPQREERTGVHLEQPTTIQENASTVDYDQESHELAMAVALASLASGGVPSEGTSAPFLATQSDEAVESASPPSHKQATPSLGEKDKMPEASVPNKEDLPTSSAKNETESGTSIASSTKSNDDTSSSGTFGPAPVTPEKRMPTGPSAGRHSQDDDEEHSVDDDNDAEDDGENQDSKSQRRRVHFAPGVKPDGGRRRIPQSRHHYNHHQHHHNFIPTLGARAVARRHAPNSRAFRMIPAFPPNHPQRWMMPPSTTLSYPREETPVVWQPPPTIRRMSAGAPPSALDEAGHGGKDDGANNDNKWICDYCHVASFDTYQAACDHELICPWRRQPSTGARKAPHPHQLVPTQLAASKPVDCPAENPPQVEESQTKGPGQDPGSEVKAAIAGANLAEEKREGQGAFPAANTRRDTAVVSFPLGIPDRDHQWLDDTECLIRQKCVEVVCDPSRLGKVGVRCQFCHGNVTPGDGQVGHLAALYNVVMQGWAKYHYPCCPAIKTGTVPSQVMIKLEKHFSKQQSNAMPEGDIHTRHYWIGAAQALGLVDTPNGVQLLRGPDASMVLPGHSPNMEGLDLFMRRGPPEVGRIVTMKPRIPTAAHHHPVAHMLHPHHSVPQPPPQQPPPDQDGQYLVFASDTEVVPPYVYFLLRQVEKCYFSEADRFVARSKGPIGFAGFQCRHCHGHAGLGKYFPISAKSLSTNSTSQNVHAHLLKCRHCPPATKQELLALKEEKSRAPRLEPGWRKVFFDKIWGRLHQKSNQNTETQGTQKGASLPVEH